MNAPVSNPMTVEEAAEILRAGHVCAFATETVYGLGGDATNPDAVLAIFETKGRPRFNPLIIHCAHRMMAERYAEFGPLARKLAQRFWPGPLTLVLPAKPGSGLADLVTAGLDTLALRVPAHEAARALIAEVGVPLAAPSANPSGRLSPTTAHQVTRAFEGRVPVLDGGVCESGLESTILAIDGDEVVQLRAGALPRGDIETFLGRPVALAAHDAAVAAPGMLKSHYAPMAILRLDADEPTAHEAYLAFGREPKNVEKLMLNLSPSEDLREAARNLFAYLARLDASGVERIAVAPIPAEGLGEAINDRLQRAAAPRG